MKVARNPVIVAQLAYVFARAGKKGKARAILSSLEAQVKERYVCGFNVAALYVALGETTNAFGWLDKAYRDRSD
jgi:2-keto-3-deoxy-L-rhamnonate aldolase RhmA